MLDTSIKVKTDQYDGPLALLLHLIQKEEMSIRELDLTKITNQYLLFIKEMEELNFDLAGDYLFLASSLVLMKSKNAISEDEKSLLQELAGEQGALVIDSEAELIRRLEELERIQALSKRLWALPKKGHEIFIKPKVNRKVIINSILTPVDLSKLVMAKLDIMEREKRKFTMVKRDRLSIKEKLAFLKNYLKLGDSKVFEDLLKESGEEFGIQNIVITFISLLELARLKRITVFQNEALGPIYLKVVKTLEDFDVDTATGFEPEGEGEEKAEKTEEKEDEVKTVPPMPIMEINSEQNIPLQ